jgi:hypothetical protein
MPSADVVREWMEIAGLPDDLYDPGRRMCGFNFLGRFDVVVEAPKASEDVFVSIDIVNLAEASDPAELLMRCMKLNAYGLETRGAALGYDENSRMVILSYRINGASIDAAALSSLVNNLVDVAQTLQDRLKAMNVAARPAAPVGGEVILKS